MAIAFPELKNPPISEVVCGFLCAESVPVTPVSVGRYWASRLADFPSHEIRDAISDDAQGVFFGPPPLRTWLLSGDGRRLVQIQPDRFFVNWRRLADTDSYPHFQNERGEEPLLPYAIREWERYRQFSAEIGMPPDLAGVELAKIDIFIQGQHWADSADLGRLLPSLAPILGRGGRDVAWRYVDRPGPDQVLTVAAGSGVHRASKRPVLRLETKARVGLQEGGDIRAAFLMLDEIVDRAFFDLLEPSELVRFK